MPGPVRTPRLVGPASRTVHHLSLRLENLLHVRHPRYHDRLVQHLPNQVGHGKRDLLRVPCEFLMQVLEDPTLSDHYQSDPAHSWMLAAEEMAIPVCAPGPRPHSA